MNKLLTPLDDDSSTSTDTLDSGNAAIELAANWNGPCCEKCSAPMKSDGVTVCRRCGWYASLGQFVEIDQGWETYSDDAEQPAPTAAPSHAEVWLNLLPRWAWIVLATVAAVVIESIAARLLTPAGSTFRTAWSLSQLVVGVTAFAGCHVFNFLVAVADDPDTGALDLILRPLKLWIKAIKNLPARQWVTDTAAAGLTATVMSLVVIGGLPYERLWDWGFEKPNNQNLLGAVVSQVQKVEGDGADNLEDAVSDFAGTQNLGPDGKPTPPPKPRLKTDCIILGYRLGAAGKLQSLILGTAYREKLVYACSVMPQVSAEESAELLQMLTDSRSGQPYLTMPIDAQWVVPKYSCRVSYESQQENTGRLLNPRWEEFAGQIR